ncbi:hypothetical protein KIW84_012444 [Lathyrus oleraceus]|uniref:Uncharacterized protein n=1 Tax=Pisum sativum TaxID=3888 RepID=A0A9D5BHL4_PEA|nr:hypothetical protein KIW84_012444 [Pisum sativum]
MEVILTVTRNQEELKVLVETPRGHRPFEYGDVSVGQPRPNLADSEGLNLDGNHANGHGNASRNQGLHSGPVGNQGFILGNQGNPNFNPMYHGYVPPPPPPSYHSPQAIPGEIEINVPAGDMRYQRLEERLKAVGGKGLLGMDMMDIGLVPGCDRPIKELEKDKVEKVEEEIAVISIPYTLKRIPAPTRPVPLVVTLPGPIPYSREKAVPWNYGSDVYYHGVKKMFIPVPAKKEGVEKEDVNVGDFSGTGRITRSGRVFAPPNPQDVADVLAKAKGKQVVDGPEPV